MARPKYGEQDPRAYEVIVDAFWDYLRETPYEKMNIRELSRRAGVNKNTFYYHFTCMDDLTDFAIEGALLRESAAALAKHLFESDTDLTARQMIGDIDPLKLERLSILLSENGTALTGRVTEKIIGAWVSSFDFDLESADARQNCFLQFVAGGFVGALRGKDPVEYGEVIDTFAESQSLRTFIREFLAG